MYIYIYVLLLFVFHARQMETEVVSMTAAMMNGDDDTVGFMTSGGTESILMAVKAYRDRARKLFPHIKKPEIVRSSSSFESGNNYYADYIMPLFVR